jgi:hypothetical protein
MELNPPSFDIRKLYRHQERRNDQKRVLYETIMHKVHHRIETVAARSETQCFFQVPEFIMGMPLYDSFHCSGYIIQRLKSEGFLVQYAHPNTLHVNWSQHLIEPFVRELDEKEKKKLTGTNDRMQQQPQPQTSAPLAWSTTYGVTAPPKLEYHPTGKLFGQ